jgi:hypothetical protein
MPDPCFTRHRYPVRVSDSRYVCAWCGEYYVGRREVAPQAPPSWRYMSLSQLQMWYARNVIRVVGL